MVNFKAIPGYTWSVVLVATFASWNWQSCERKGLVDLCDNQ